MVERSPQRKKKRRRPPEAPPPNEKVQNWGLGLIAVGLIGLLLPTFGLQLRRLQALGEAQWIVLAITVIVGCGAVLWANRGRPAFGVPVAGVAFVAMLVFAYVSFWRHAGDAAAPLAVAGGGGELAGGAGDAVQPRGVVPQLNVKFEGDIPADDFALLSEFMKDCVPAATSISAGHGSQPTGPGGRMMIDNPRFVIGPVSDVEQLPDRITFGEASMIDGSTLRVRVKLPLPPRAESIRRRLQFTLDGIHSDDVARQRNGMLLLESLEPLDRREEVATELVAIMSRPNSGVSVSGALKKWGTPAQAAKLRELVAQEGTNTSELLDILVFISPDDAIRAAIDLIPREPSLAEGTLTRVGAASEPPAIELLSHPESQARLVACKVLLQVGTQASLAPLAPLEQDSDREVASYATRTISTIRERSSRRR